MDFACDEWDCYDDEEQEIEELNESVEELLNLVRPLVCRRGGKPESAVERNIVLGAHGLSDEGNDELDKVCWLFSMVLERTAKEVVDALSWYLSSQNGECALTRFAMAMERLSTMLIEAEESSRLNAFVGKVEELLYTDERF
jgi:hypothetical protein